MKKITVKVNTGLYISSYMGYIFASFGYSHERLWVYVYITLILHI